MSIKKAFCDFLVFSGFSLVSLTAFSQPEQIDIVGIKPGVSSYNDVRDRISQIPGHGNRGLLISGHGLLCLDPNPLGSYTIYTDGVLSQLWCSFGWVYNDSDGNPPRGYYPGHQTFRVLERGYTEKFGPPTESETREFSNNFGHSVTQSTLIWEDKQGNRLTIIWPATETGTSPIADQKWQLRNGIGNLDFGNLEGKFLLESRAQIEKDEKALKADDREF